MQKNLLALYEKKIFAIKGLFAVQILLAFQFIKLVISKLATLLITHFLTPGTWEGHVTEFCKDQLQKQRHEENICNQPVACRIGLRTAKEISSRTMYCHQTGNYPATTTTTTTKRATWHRSFKDHFFVGREVDASSRMLVRWYDEVMTGRFFASLFLFLFLFSLLCHVDDMVWIDHPSQKIRKINVIKDKLTDLDFFLLWRERQQHFTSFARGRALCLNMVSHITVVRIELLVPNYLFSGRS